MAGFTSVEKAFIEKSGRKSFSTRLPYIVVNNFPDLGLLTTLRFIEWVFENPDGVISLPTGKIPEYFIKWTGKMLADWDNPQMIKIRKDNGLLINKKPSLSGLHFVQIDEFYPINPRHHNSFYDYVMNYYIKGFNLDPSRAILINPAEIPLPGGKSFTEVFPDNIIDLTLRHRDAVNSQEKTQRDSLFSIDDWCMEYESKIRELGGPGFFLGGIEVSRSRLVITIGLGTITYNPEGVSIIFAAGEAKAGVIRDALENTPTNLFPATALQRQKNARLYLTEGAAVMLHDTVGNFYRKGPWKIEKTERAIFDLCRDINKYAHKLTLEDLKNDRYCSMIPDLELKRVKEVVESTRNKIEAGLKKEENQVFLHTGPHHDDIMLGIFPCIIPQLRVAFNEFHFVVMTSGFTAVTNKMLKNLMMHTLEFIDQGRIQMLEYPDFFKDGYRYKFDKDVSHYLDKVADKDLEGSGPDTHYKVLQAIAEALRQWKKEKDLSGLRIVGYRNVWYKFHPSEDNIFTPVSLNSMAVLDSSFRNCYISQVDASFPSHEYDGPFSDLSLKIWVEQFKRVQLVLGKDFFYENNKPKIRATYGMVYHKEMKIDEFLRYARELEKSIEGVAF